MLLRRSDIVTRRFDIVVIPQSFYTMSYHINHNLEDRIKIMENIENLNHLLSRVAQKDHHAFQTLYQKVSPKLYAVCLSIFHNNKEVAEDVLQESFIKIWKSAASFHAERGNAMTWMIALTRNQSIDYIRYNKRRPVFEAEKDYETIEYKAPTHQPDQQQAITEEMDKIIKALDSLPAKHKECVMQSFYYGYSHNEIAQRMSLPLGTVKAWIRRSLEKLRIENQQGDGLGLSCQ